MKASAVFLIFSYLPCMLIFYLLPLALRRHSGEKKAFSLIFRMHPYQGYPVPEDKVSAVEIDATKIAARAKA